jgi:hypothetical protein
VNTVTTGTAGFIFPAGQPVPGFSPRGDFQKISFQTYVNPFKKNYRLPSN